MRSSLNILSTQAFSLHWLHHLCRLSQASSYPFYLIFVLLTSPILGIATATSLVFCKVSCLVDVADIQVHSTIDNFVAIINVVHCKAIVKKTAVVNCAKAEEKYVKRVVSLGKSRYPKIVSTNSKTKYKLWQQALQLKQ